MEPLDPQTSRLEGSACPARALKSWATVTVAVADAVFPWLSDAVYTIR